MGGACRPTSRIGAACDDMSTLIPKAAAKEQAKLDRAQARADARAAKQAETERTKRERQRLKTNSDQSRGKYAHLEVACLIDERWVEGRGDSYYQRVSVRDKVQQQMAQTGGYVWQSHDCHIGCRAIQWIRRDFLEGGAADAYRNLKEGKHNGYQHIPILAVVVHGKEFLKLLERDFKEQDDDYPELENWLKRIQEQYRTTWKAKTDAKPRVILLLDQVKERLDTVWKAYNKTKAKNPNLIQPPTSNELQDAITWLLIEFQVEVIHCNTTNNIVYEICKMTRLLGEEPYLREVSELDCVRKLKSQIDIDEASELERSCPPRFAVALAG